MSILWLALGILAAMLLLAAMILVIGEWVKAGRLLDRLTDPECGCSDDSSCALCNGCPCPYCTSRRLADVDGGNA